MTVNFGYQERFDYKELYRGLKGIKALKCDRMYSDDGDLIEEIIPSKDVRENNQRNVFEYTPFEIAGLFSKAQMPFFRKIKELKNIQKKFDKKVDSDFYSQLEDCIGYMKCSYYLFADNREQDCFYTISTLSEDGEEEANRIFYEYNDVRDFSKRYKGRKFWIYKKRPDESIPKELEDKDCFVNSFVGRAHYDEKGDLTDCEYFELPKPVDKKGNFYFYTLSF